MPQQRILLVDGNTRRADALRESISGQMLPAPIHREDGESAVLWAGANPCDLCIIAYELPGIDGLESLARIRNRSPDLPAIMYAESDDQYVAIAAFRSGVFDFVPATGSFTRIVAERAQALLEPDSQSQQSRAYVTEDPSLKGIPADRLKFTYQNRLRTIGRQLDIYRYHSVAIIEIKGGFIARATPRKSRRPEALEFPDRDFPRLVASAIDDNRDEAEKPTSSSDLLPTGYEDALRAIGFKLDEITAENIVITEFDDIIVVGGRGSDINNAVHGIVPFKYFLKQPDIEYMLNEAFRRRGTPQKEVKRKETDSGSLRNILRRLN